MSATQLAGRSLAYCRKKLGTFRTFLQQDWYRSVFVLLLGILLPEYLGAAMLLPSLYFAVRCAKKEKLSPHIGKLGWLLLFYIGTMYVSIAVSLHPVHSLLMSLLWTVLAMGYFIMTTIINSLARLRAVCSTALAMLLVCGIISIVQYTLHGPLGLSEVPLNFWEPLDMLVLKQFPMELVLTWLGTRTAATFNNPNLYGQLAVMLLPFGVYCAVTAARKTERWGYGIMILISLLGVLFTFSRGSYLGLLLAIAVFLALNIRRSKNARIALVVVLVVVLLFVLIPNPFMQRLETIDSQDIAINKRLDAWQTAWDAIVQRPLLGYGAGTLNAMDIIQAAGIDGTPHTHNAILELLLEGGILALLPFVLMCVRFVNTNVRLWKQDDSHVHSLGVASLAMFSGFALNIMVDYPFSVPKLSIAFMVILALSDVVAQLCGIVPMRKLEKKQKNTVK